MINIENTQVITYGNNQKVTAYRDFDDDNKYYIVPTPVIPLGDDGVPMLSLVEYDTGTDVSGTCAFQTELQVSADALAAVKAKLGAGITIGQFDWQSVKVQFHFATNASAAMTLIAVPSMYGSNRASFIMHLPDQNTVNDFKNAFGPSGSQAGTFMLEYDVTALTKLPPVTVTVDFNAQTAYDYEKTVHVSKDTWGHVTSRTTTITAHLQQSQAGKITVDPGGQPLDPATKKRLQDWGNATLQNDVSAAVAEATKMMNPQGAAHFSMSAVSSFHDVYSEGQVVPWIISPRAPIPAVAADQWDKVFSHVSHRKMAAAFTVQNLGDNNVASVNLVVTYPLNATAPAANNSYEFTPSSPSSWIFNAPGNDNDGIFDGKYSYHYTVNYGDGTAPYTSPEIISEDSATYITANDLNLLEVTFTAQNVPFAGSTGADTVDYVLVDMFFVNTADGDAVAFQQARLTDANHSHTFKSQTHKPFNNPYQYKLTYVLKGGQQVVIDWQTSNIASVENMDVAKVPVVNISSPFQTKLIDLFLMAGDGKSFDMVALNVTYDDSVNNLHEQHQWGLHANPMTPGTWQFLAPANQNGQVVSYNGLFSIGGVPTNVQAAKTNLNTILLNPAYPQFAVTIDPSQVEWTTGNLTQVEVLVYTKDDQGQMANISQIPPFHSDNQTPALHSFPYAAGTTPTYFYSLKYWVQGQATPNLIPETKVDGDPQLTLPGTAPAQQPTLQDA